VVARTGLLLIILAVTGWDVASAGAALEASPVSFQLAGRTEVFELAPSDADAFQRRLSPPPPYAGPLPSGEPVTITTDYWDEAFGSGAGRQPVSRSALYHSSDGVVRVQQGDRFDFFVLDQRQRALLARYIRLARVGAIGTNPGALEVLIAASAAEPIGVEVGGQPLDEALQSAFWRALDAQGTSGTLIEPPRPPDRRDGYWVTFSTAEGRSQQYFYEPGTGRLTDFLGTEGYTIRGVLPESAGAAPQIEQQASPGSKLWWPLMLGGGAALLTVAVLLQRLSTGREATTNT
jgi:hypothetical protein